MEELKVTSLIKTASEKSISSFANNTRATLNVSTQLNKVEVSYEWLDIMEDTIRYLDNILRNPNRFIINDEEIVKVELARRITVDSIKHLAKHTNYITKIEDNGDVKPSKILNINKEESYDTYENRLIYTLIDNMQTYVEIKKKEANLSSSMKDTKKIEYTGKSKIGKENIGITMSLDSNLNDNGDDGSNENGTLAERIAKLDQNIKMLTNTDVYKDLRRKHVARVIPPIKKTNVILKNTNFQYAMKLWDFLQNHIANDSKKTKNNKNYEDNGILKEYFNDTFLLNYLAMNTIDKELTQQEQIQAVDEITDKLIERIVELNINLPEAVLKEKLGDKIAITKYKKQAALLEIQNAFTKSIDNYLERIQNFKY